MPLEYIPLPKQSKDLAGQRFGRLIAIGPIGQTKAGLVRWHCICDCGQEKITTGKLLIRGETQSCGCLHIETILNRSTKHGGTYHPLYALWCQIKGRCSNPNNKSYSNYGGRGIFICDEWKDSFDAFCRHVSQLSDYGKQGYSIDRIDNDGPYSPNNVRWASPKRQNRNTRSTVMLTHQGRTQSLSDWADELNIPVNTLHSRLRYGWSIDRVIGTPARSTSRRRDLTARP